MLCHRIPLVKKKSLRQCSLSQRSDSNGKLSDSLPWEDEGRIRMILIMIRIWHDKDHWHFVIVSHELGTELSTLAYVTNSHSSLLKWCEHPHSEKEITVQREVMLLKLLTKTKGDWNLGVSGFQVLTLSGTLVTSLQGYNGVFLVSRSPWYWMVPFIF